MAVSKRLRFEIFRRDGHTCTYCGRTPPEVKLQVDHVVAEALGGKTEAANLVTACADCNAGKSATPADAPLIEAVSESTLRWSAALRQAADRMLADLVGRNECRDEFEARWNRWSVDGAAIPLPVDWAPSVDRFLAAGLPLPVLLDCIDLAMANQKLQLAAIFRYMCGIVWNKVNELQDAARDIADDAQGPQVEDVDDITTGRAMFASELLRLIGGEDEERFTRQAAKAADVIDAVGGAPFSAHAVLEDAALIALSSIVKDRDTLMAAVASLLTLVDDAAVAAASALEEPLEPSKERRSDAEKIAGVVARLVEIVEAV